MSHSLYCDGWISAIKIAHMHSCCAMPFAVVIHIARIIHCVKHDICLKFIEPRSKLHITLNNVEITYTRTAHTHTATEH